MRAREQTEAVETQSTRMKDETLAIETMIARASTRSEALDAVLTRAVELGFVSFSDAVEIREGIDRRHALGSPTLGNGLAVPHLRHGSLDDYRLILAKTTEPISDWDTLDQEPVDLVFLILAPVETRRHLLPAFERFYRDLARGLTDRLRACRTATELAEVLATRSEC